MTAGLACCKTDARHTAHGCHTVMIQRADNVRCVVFCLFIANSVSAKQNGYWMRVIIDFQIIAATLCDDRRNTGKNGKTK